MIAFFGMNFGLLFLTKEGLSYYAGACVWMSCFWSRDRSHGCFLGIARVIVPFGARAGQNG